LVPATKLYEFLEPHSLFSAHALDQEAVKPGAKRLYMPPKTFGTWFRGPRGSSHVRGQCVKIGIGAIVVIVVVEKCRSPGSHAITSGGKAHKRQATNLACQLLQIRPGGVD
jgi:hypothetical protein